MSYTGTGFQTLSELRLPQARFDQLKYEIIGYNGTATFGFDPGNGSAIVGGPISDVTTLERGSLIAGSPGSFPPSSERAGPGRLVTRLTRTRSRR